MEETRTILTKIKEDLEQNIRDIENNYTQFIPTLYVGVVMGYQTAIKYIEQSLEEIDEKK